MNICDIPADILKNPDLFWSALGAIAQSLEAIVVLVSAGALFYQLPQLRREIVENRIDGLTRALEALDVEDFKKVVNAQDTSIYGVNWDLVMERINLVALMISEKYTNETLLLGLKGQDLNVVFEYLNGNEGKKVLFDLDVQRRYGLGWNLLTKAHSQAATMDKTDK